MNHSSRTSSQSTVQNRFPIYIVPFCFLNNLPTSPFSAPAWPLFSGDGVFKPRWADPEWTDEISLDLSPLSGKGSSWVVSFSSCVLRSSTRPSSRLMRPRSSVCFSFPCLKEGRSWRRVGMRPETGNAQLRFALEQCVQGLTRSHLTFRLLQLKQLHWLTVALSVLADAIGTE